MWIQRKRLSEQKIWMVIYIEYGLFKAQITLPIFFEWSLGCRTKNHNGAWVQPTILPWENCSGLHPSLPRISVLAIAKAPRPDPKKRKGSRTKKKDFKKKISKISENWKEIKCTQGCGWTGHVVGLKNRSASMVQLRVARAEPQCPTPSPTKKEKEKEIKLN